MSVSGSLGRGLSVLTVLASEADGLPLSDIAERLEIPKSAVHRALGELSEHGFTRQLGEGGNYALSLRFASLALRYLAQFSVVDLARPSLQLLATRSEELARLSLAEGDDLFWVDKRQGAKSGLRYDDPDMGAKVTFRCSASGLAWLSAFSDQRIVELLEKQGFEGHPRAPGSVDEVMFHVERARRDGYSFVDSIHEIGLAGIAAPIVPEEGGEPIGTLSVAGPNVRFTRERAESLVPLLLGEARQLEDLLRGR